MPQYTFGYTGTSTTANGGSINWSVTPIAGASTGNTTMPPIAGLVSYALTSVQGTENPAPSIPAGAAILGISMQIWPYCATANCLKDVTAQLLKNGTPLANRAANAYLGTLNTYPASPVIYGGPTDLWGTTWLPSDIASLDWLYQVKNISGSGTVVDVNGLTITVYTSGGGGGRRDSLIHQLNPNLAVFPPIGKRIF